MFGWGDAKHVPCTFALAPAPGTVTVEDVQVARAEGTAKPKPCPFCGGAGTPINWVAEGTQAGDPTMLMWYVIECIECGATGPEHTDADSALAGWNTRVR